jgi:hypothetical protein
LKLLIFMTELLLQLSGIVELALLVFHVMPQP